MNARFKFLLRATNALVSLLLLVLLLAHTVSGGFMLLGVNGSTAKPLSWAAMALAAVHALIGLFFTFGTISRRGAFAYAGLNARFWAIRASGVAVLLLLCLHVGAFGTVRSGQFVLFEFTAVKFAAHILLAAALAVHVLCALRPMLVSLGMERVLGINPALLMFLSVMLLFSAAALIVYFFMWL